jgi:hypothetical protein
MPLLDQFRPPLSLRRHWDSLHGAWAEAIAGDLNRSLLPEKYVAEARVKLGGHVEIDVGTFAEADLLGLLRVQLSTTGQGVRDLYATAYRTVPAPQGLRLETWAHALALGGSLPTLPLWLQPDLSLPLDLEGTYQAACIARRIGW